MAIWFGKKGDAGWTAVDARDEGLAGVTVLAPHAPGGKPRVAACAILPGAKLDVDSLIALGKKVSVGACPWTLPLQHKTYSILVVPEPSVKPDEIDQSVRWSIDPLIDYPVDDASIAWMRIPTANLLQNRPHDPQLYVIAARYDLIAEHKALFQKAGVALRAIDVRETAQRNIAALAEKPGEGVGLLLIGGQGVQFTVSFNGELYLDRFFEESLFDSAEDADAQARACERIVLQIQRSLDFVGRNLPFIDVHRILLAPMPGHLELGDFISRHLPVPVESLDLASLFDFSLTPELARQETQALCFSALGAALRFLKSTP